MAFCENVTNTFCSDIDGMQYDKTHRKIPQTSHKWNANMIELLSNACQLLEQLVIFHYLKCI